VVQDSTTGVGTSPGLSKGEVKLWPNPASSVLYFEANEDVNVGILSVDGRVLIRDCFVPSRSGGTSGVGIGSLSNGLYILKVYSEQGTLLKVQKLLKE